MAAVFTSEDVKVLLKHKKVVLMGDSNTRGIYKDLVWLSDNSTYVPQRKLKAKLESSYMGDLLVDRGQLSHGRNFLEHRRYRCSPQDITIEFHFCTSVYSDRMERRLTQLENSPPALLIVNSCVWDLCRWGPHGLDAYKRNLPRFLEHLKRPAFADTLVLWITALPVSSEQRGGFLIKQVEFLRHTLRFDVMEANSYCSQLVSEYGFDVLDLHHALRCLIHNRNRDGVHWAPRTMRFITNSILNHVSLSWNVPLPSVCCWPLLRRMLQRMQVTDEEMVELSGKDAGLGQHQLDMVRASTTYVVDAFLKRAVQGGC